MHHELKRGGFGVRQTLGILILWQTCYALVGLAGLYLGVSDVVMFVGWTVAGLSQHRLIHRMAARNRARLRAQIGDKLGDVNRQPSTF